MKRSSLLFRYIGIKIGVLALVFVVLLVHRKAMTFWYDDKATFEDTRRTLQDGINQGTLDINQYNTAGLTPLMIASMEGNLPLVQLLLYYGADVTLRARRDPLFLDTMGSTALHFAVYNGYPDVTQELLRHGADPLALTVYKNTPLHGISFIANVFYQVELFRLLMSHGANLNMQNDEGATILHWMIAQGNSNVVQQAVEDYGDFINLSARDNNGYTIKELAQPLEWYPDQATPVMNVLRGLDNTTLGLAGDQYVNTINQKGFAGVHLAAIQGNAEYMKRLLDRGADLSLKAPDTGNTPLFSAAQFGFVPVVQMLFDAQAPVTVVNNKGETIPMALLGIYSQPERIKFLKLAVERGADLNATDNDGNTLLHHAVLKHDIAFVARLVQLFGDKINMEIKNSNGLTPYALAQQKKYVDVVRVLPRPKEL